MSELGGETADAWAPDMRRGGPEQAEVGNHLLRVMPPEDYASLRPHLRRVPLRIGDEPAAAGSPIDALWFPEGAVAGLLDVLGDGRRLTVALVGREGCLGWPLLLGRDRWPYDASVRGEDATALRIDADLFLRAAERRPGSREPLLRFADAVTAQMGRTVVSNLIHGVERRTARWILLYRDRLRSEEIALTHEELGLMLGVRRASVTDALHHLEGAGAIRSLRGRVVVRDRAALEALAGEAYGFAESEYRRSLGPYRGSRDGGSTI